MNRSSLIGACLLLLTEFSGGLLALAQPPANDGPTTATAQIPPGEPPPPPPPRGNPPPVGQGVGQGVGPGQGQGPGRRGGPGPAGQRGFQGQGRGFGPPGRGFGPGQGPGFPPPPIDGDDFRQRWARLDGGRLIELTSTLESLSHSFDSLETDRDRLLGELEKARNGSDATQMGPMAVLRNQQIEKLLGSLHDSVEQQRRIESQGGWLLNLIENNKSFVEQMLDRVDNNARAGERISGPRSIRWKNAMAALENNQRPRWSRLLLGDNLGPLALRWAGQEGPGDDGPEATALGGQLADRLARRQETLDNLVKRVMELNATVERQGQEIERLKRILTNDAATSAGQVVAPPKK